MNVTVELDLEDVGEEELRDATRDLARVWASESLELLYDRGEDAGYEVQGVAQSQTPPEWEDGAWTFAYSHVNAARFEWGTEPHTIEPNPPTKMLKFPWPDMPSGMREDFEPMWRDPSHFLEEPEVLLPKVEHPGTDALRYMRDSREALR